jgi:hypothetical protein
MKSPSPNNKRGGVTDRHNFGVLIDNAVEYPKREQGGVKTLSQVKISTKTPPQSHQVIISIKLTHGKKFIRKRSKFRGQSPHTTQHH